MDFRLYLALTVQRILNRHWIKLGPAEQENIIYTQEYSIACKMMNLFKSRYDFFIPQDELPLWQCIFWADGPLIIPRLIMSAFL